MDLELRREALNGAVAVRLISALNAELSVTYPEQGATHFRLDPDEVAEGHGAFLVAYLDSIPVGCGAIRRLDDTTAEIKRMFVEPVHRGRGISRRILNALETEARQLDYRRVVLETGVRQLAALALYQRAGFTRIPPFGEYVGSPLSICMEKLLADAAPAGNIRLLCRAAVAEDAEAIADLVQDAFAEFRAQYTPNGLAATTPGADVVRARMSEGPTWVVEEGGSILGTVAVKALDEGLYVRTMAVRGVARGRGVATMLLAQIERFAVECGHRRLYLSTTPFLSAAIALYTRAGFQFTGETSDLFGTPLRTMEKYLQMPSQ